VSREIAHKILCLLGDLFSKDSGISGVETARGERIGRIRSGVFEVHPGTPVPYAPGRSCSWPINGRFHPSPCHPA
jgi:hypothetical protein